MILTIMENFVRESKGIREILGGVGKNERYFATPFLNIHLFVYRKYMNSEENSSGYGLTSKKKLLRI